MHQHDNNAFNILEKINKYDYTYKGMAFHFILQYSFCLKRVWYINRYRNINASLAFSHFQRA